MADLSMSYELWIERERRIRTKLLEDSTEIKRTGLYRVCRQCGEICLCHEQCCPNCGGDEINGTTLPRAEVGSAKRIRCRRRFDNLSKTCAT